jgi:hypothetical protein
MALAEVLARRPCEAPDLRAARMYILKLFILCAIALLLVCAVALLLVVLLVCEPRRR